MGLIQRTSPGKHGSLNRQIFTAAFPKWFKLNVDKPVKARSQVVGAGIHAKIFSDTRRNGLLKWEWVFLEPTEWAGQFLRLWEKCQSAFPLSCVACGAAQVHLCRATRHACVATYAAQFKRNAGANVFIPEGTLVAFKSYPGSYFKQEICDCSLFRKDSPDFHITAAITSSVLIMPNQQWQGNCQIWSAVGVYIPHVYACHT